MKFKRLRIDYTPCHLNPDKYSELRMEVRIDDEVFNSSKRIETDLFTSVWEALLMEICNSMKYMIDDKYYYAKDRNK